MMDDWIHLRNQHFDGVLGTGEYLGLARPGAALVFAATTGLLHDHPAWVYVVQVGVTIANAVALRRLLRQFIPAEHALVCAAVWLLLPIHSATDHWAAALNISTATLLLLVGSDRLVRAARGEGPWWPAGLAFVVGMLCYEAVAPLAVVAVVAAGWRSGELRKAWATGGWLAVTGGWMLAHTPKSATDELFDVASLPAAHFGPTAFGRMWPVIAALMTVGAVMAVRRRTVEGLMVAAGVAVVAVGMSAFIRFPMDLIGIGDRANAATSFGTALVVSGALMSVSARRTLLVVVVVAVAVAPVRLERDREYAWAGDRAVSLLDGARFSEDGGAWIGTCPPYRGFVAPLQGYWDAEPALQYRYDERTLSGGFELSAPMGVWVEGRGCELRPFRRAIRLG